MTVLTTTVSVLQTNDSNIELVAGSSIDIFVLLSSGLDYMRGGGSNGLYRYCPGNIVADELGVRAGGDIALIAAIDTNNVNQFAARSEAGDISYGNSDELQVEAVTAGVCGFSATTGALAVDGDILIQTARYGRDAAKT